MACRGLASARSAARVIVQEDSLKSPSYKIEHCAALPEEPYEVFAIRYATATRRYGDNFIVSGDPHDDAAMRDFNYYMWLVRNKARTYVVDTGFTEATCLRRGGGREITTAPETALLMLGVDASRVEDVIVTHLHYDHIGNFALFPSARFHLQDSEMEYATGRCMAHHVFSHPFEVEDVKEMVGRVYEGRVSFHDGDSILAPGLSVHHIGGHSKGLQCVRVYTRIGWIVLASDAAHLYDNMEQERPFPIIHDLEAMISGFARLRELVDDPRFIVPGHDAQVMDRYPAVSEELDGVAVRVDVVPEIRS